MAVIPKDCGRLAEVGFPIALQIIDLGAGHAQEGESLTGRVLATLKSHALRSPPPGARLTDSRRRATAPIPDTTPAGAG